MKLRKNSTTDSRLVSWSARGRETSVDFMLNCWNEESISRNSMMKLLKPKVSFWMKPPRVSIFYFPTLMKQIADDDPEAKVLNKHRYHPTNRESQQLPVTNAITYGTMIGGQCLCACPTTSHSQSFGSYPDQFVQKPASTIANVPPTATAGVASYTGYRGGYYPQYYTRGAIMDPLTAVEMGITDGLEKFFSGQPPPIR